MADALKALSFKIEDNQILVPSHVDLVEGLEGKIDAHISAYDNTTLTNRINGLANVYLGKNAKAVDSAKADSCTTAFRASYDDSGDGKRITEKYYKTTDTVDRAVADEHGDNFRQKYARQDGNYGGLTAGHSATAGTSAIASLDAKGNAIHNYVKSFSTNGQTVTYTRGDNSTGTFTTKDTTYELANDTKAGLMSANEHIKLRALSTDTSAQSVSHAATADTWKTPRKLTVSGAGSGNVTMNGGADVTLSLGSLNASSITAGTLAVVRGGTGQTNLDNVTVGKAKAFDSARNVALSGAVSGTTNWSGNTALSIVTNNIDVSKTTAGVLPTLNGGTGRTDGYAQGLAKEPYINGVQFNGASDILFFGTSPTDAAAKAFTVNLSNSNFQLKEGVIVWVKFNSGINMLTVQGTMTLNVAGTGAYSVYMHGRVVDGNSTQLHLSYNSVVPFVWINNAWHIIILPAVKLQQARSFRIAGGITANAVDFDGTSNVALNAGNINFNNFQSVTGALPAANGGTGQTDGTVAKLHTARKINGIDFDGSANVGFVYLCNTAADVAAKTTTSYNTAPTQDGSVILVRFMYVNTADDPTLSINGGPAMPIQRSGGSYTAGAHLSNITRYDYQCVWLLNVENRYWRIIDDPAGHTLTVKGELTGSANMNKDGDYSINVTLDRSKTFTVTNTLVPNTCDGYQSGTKTTSLNILTTPGDYILGYENSSRGYWNHKPSNMPDSPSHLLIVRANNGGNLIHQTILSHSSGVFWQRGYNGSWSDWKYFAGETVSATVK